MPITYDRDDERRRIVVTTIGIVGIDDLLVTDRQASEETWQYGVLYDSLRVASVASQTDVRTGLKHVEMLARTHGRRGPVAFVTTMPAAYGMVRMYSTLAGQLPRRSRSSAISGMPNGGSRPTRSRGRSPNTDR